MKQLLWRNHLFHFSKRRIWQKTSVEFTFYPCIPMISRAEYANREMVPCIHFRKTSSLPPRPSVYLLPVPVPGVNPAAVTGCEGVAGNASYITH